MDSIYRFAPQYVVRKKKKKKVLKKVLTKGNRRAILTKLSPIGAHERAERNGGVP